MQYCVISPVYDDAKFGNVVLADIVLENPVLERKNQVAFVKRLVDKVFTNNESVSIRQIPAWFRFRTELPLTANSKINYGALRGEKITGSEISVLIEETNISIGSISIQ